MKKNHLSRILVALMLACVPVGGSYAQPEDIEPPQITEEAPPPEPVEQYLQAMKLVDGLHVYNEQLETLLQDQQREIRQLNTSISQAAFIERQIGPLTERMINTLEMFIELDVPFLLEQRRRRVRELRETLDRADISATEKFREVLRAYQQEIEYGETKEAYVDIIELDGQTRQVDVLRWGRIVLAFQTPDGEITGAWDNDAREWRILGDEYRIGVRDGLRIARKTMTDNLVVLPTPAPNAD